jgi:hypothetical protein
VNPDGTLSVRTGPRVLADLALKATGSLLLLVLLAYLMGGIVLPWGEGGIVGAMATPLPPRLDRVGVTFALSTRYKRRLGTLRQALRLARRHGRLRPRAVLGLHRLFAGVLGWIATHDPLAAVSGLKNKAPGIPVPGRRAPRAPALTTSWAATTSPATCSRARPRELDRHADRAPRHHLRLHGRASRWACPAGLLRRAARHRRSASSPT